LFLAEADVQSHAFVPILPKPRNYLLASHNASLAVAYEQGFESEAFVPRFEE